MRSSRTLALSAVALISALALSACGGKSTVFGHGSTSTRTVTTTPITGTTEPLPSSITTTIRITQPVTTTTATAPQTNTSATKTTGAAPAPPSTTLTGTTTTSPPKTTTTSPLKTTTTKPVSIRPVTASGDPCWTDDMKPTYLGSSGLAGATVARFSLTNTESATCNTEGWPKLEFLSTGGGILVVKLRNTARDLLGRTPSTVIDLAPGQKVWFRVITSRSGSTASTCVKATEIALTVPFDSLAQNVTVPGGVSACASATVSPLMPHYLWAAAG